MGVNILAVGVDIGWLVAELPQALINNMPIMNMMMGNILFWFISRSLSVWDNLIVPSLGFDRFIF